MSRIKAYTLGIFSIMLISSCSTTTVEEDMDEYCNCVENVKSGIDMRECLALAQEMQEKYEFDPEGAKYIQDHIQDCGKPDM